MYKTNQAMRSRHKIVFLLPVILLFSQLGYCQYTIPKKPKKQTSVYDYAMLLSADQSKKLEEKLLRYADTTSTQIVVVIINNLKGENIGLLAPRWGQQWGIGQAKEDNGILILLSKEDRRIHIAPGYGAEEKLTAGINGEIVRNVIIPEFKANKYYSGLDKGITAIMEVLNGTYVNNKTDKKEKNSKGKYIFPILIIILIIISFLRRRNNRNGGRRSRRGLDLTDILILSSMGKGGFGSGSSSGGGGFGGFGGGFGGGGFSGGGAGGSW